MLESVGLNNMSRKDPRTAAERNSIWLDLPENTFRQHLIRLEERTNAVPIDSQIFDIKTWPSITRSTRHTLPIEVEQNLGDDFARLVAVEEGAQSVAAVCLEEHHETSQLTLRFAALDISLGGVVHKTLLDMSEILARAALSLNVDKSGLVDEIFQLVIRLHFLRLLARLRSVKWDKPKYLSKSRKKPLWEDFTNLLHRVQFLYTKKERRQRQEVESSITNLASIYQNFEQVAQEEEGKTLLSLVDASFAFCGKDHTSDFLTRLENSVGVTPTPQVASAVKCLRQIQKIASYRRISIHFVDIARQFPHLFQAGFRVKYLTPYQSLPTTVAYESWATSCHVHAEVQLMIHYDLQYRKSDLEFLQPRCIGISKWLCFLCCRFLQAHGHFFPSKTHGRLYDQWTVPDLDEFGPDLAQKYRHILSRVDEEVVRQTEEEPELHRIEPMTSADGSCSPWS